MGIWEALNGFQGACMGLNNALLLAKSACALLP